MTEEQKPVINKRQRVLKKNKFIYNSNQPKNKKFLYI